MPESTDEVIQCVWQELDRAASDTGHNWRLPVLATVDGQGWPQARTVVLRETDRPARKLVIYSDRRSPKISQIRRSPPVVLVFWCRILGWQLRLSGTATVDSDSANAALIWTQLRNSPAAGDYLRPAAPGTVLTSTPADHPASAFSRTAGPPQHSDDDPPNAGGADHSSSGHFCRLIIEVEELDWLDLKAEGHRRLRWRAGRADWLVP